MPRRRQSRKSVRVQKPVVVIYNKNTAWRTFYDNNGTDEQGLVTQVDLNKTLPSASSTYGNDYNAPSTVHSTKMEVRWAAGIVNPPVAVQLVWIFPNELRTVRYPGPMRRLKNAQFVTLNAVAPRIVRNYLVADPSAETALKFEIIMFGMDLDGTKMPPMIFTTNLNQAPVQLIAHSGKSTQQDTLSSYHTSMVSGCSLTIRVNHFFHTYHMSRIILLCCHCCLSSLSCCAWSHPGMVFSYRGPWYANSGN